jgi:HEPN domain-containing protein
VSYEVWIRKALRFRECAEEDLRSGRYDSAAFFAQQAAEFRLKGVLIKLTGSPAVDARRVGAVGVSGAGEACT